MKYFLRLVFLSSVLLVLLGLFSQNRDRSDPGRPDLGGIEQIANPSGILSHQKEIPSHGSISFVSHTPDQALSKIRRFREDLYSNRSTMQLELAECLYQDIKYILHHRAGLYLYRSGSKEILS